MSSKKKILIIRFSSIGDIVLTTPVIRCISKQLAGAEIHYLTKKAFAGVLAANPYISKLHFLGKSIAETAAELKRENFDHVIDLHHNLRTLLLKTRLGVPASSFNKLNWQKWVMVRLKRNMMPPVHIVDRYLAAAAFLGVRNDGAVLDYFLEKEYKLTELLPA